MKKIGNQFGVYLTTAFYITLFGCSSTAGTADVRSMQSPQVVPAVMNPETAEKAAKTVGESWLYGDGLGTAFLNLGTTIVFPPYSVFLLGNLALTASGYESLGVGMFLDGEDEQTWDTMYSSVVSGPGKFAAAVSGNEYVTPERTTHNLQQFTELKGIDGVMGDY